MRNLCFACRVDIVEVKGEVRVGERPGVMLVEFI